MDINLTERLKERLFASIGVQIDAIGYVPNDIGKLIGDFQFDTDLLGRSDAASPADEADSASLARRVNDFYDTVFYSTDRVLGILGHDTDYKNLGYWDANTKTLNEASERLVDALLDFIPEKKGRILDVACGMGASTRRLLDHYPADRVWAINISDRQIESTRKNAPGCHAEVMNAVAMTFEDNSFDNILCVEAAFHFETRRKFLADARRILKSGGRLVLSDVLFTSRDRLSQYAIFPSPENYLATAEEYRDLLSEIGFRNVVVNDVTDAIWGAHFRYVVNRLHQEFLKGKVNIIQLTEILWSYYNINAVTGPCLLVSAQK